MAGHLETKFIEHKRFREIERVIFSEFRDYTRIRGSLKYSRLPEGRGETPDIEAWSAERAIPAGHVWGSKRGYFEIHYSPAKKQVTKIYLVA